MSRLFGPLSETMSSVSARDCALAGDHTAGAEKALAAVSAVIDLRNSRRFMEGSRRDVLKPVPQAACHCVARWCRRLNPLIHFALDRVGGLATTPARRRRQPLAQLLGTRL